MLIRDLIAMASLRSFRVFAKFWRIFKLVNHLLMSISLGIRLVAIYFHHCEAEFPTERLQPDPEGITLCQGSMKHFGNWCDYMCVVQDLIDRREVPPKLSTT